MSYIKIPTRHNSEIIAAADTNQLMDDIEAIVNGEKPVTVDSIHGIHLGALTNGQILKYTSTGSYIVSTTLTENAGQLTSPVITGTAPFIISSTTKVDNLNVDKLDGADLSTDGTFVIVSSTGSDLLISSQKATKTYVDTVASTIQAASGFSDPKNITITYNPSLRTITLTGTVLAYWKGKTIASLVSGWISDSHLENEGLWYLYYDGFNFIWTQTEWTYEVLQIALVHYSYATSSDRYAIRRDQGLMAWQTREALHESIGTYKETGGTLSDYVLSDTTSTNRRPSISECTLRDEDLITVNSFLPSDGPYTIFSLTSTGKTIFTLSSSDVIPLSGDNPYYNELSTTWNQTLMPSNSVATIWLLAVPVTSDVTSQLYRYIWVQPQWITKSTSQLSGALAIARAAEELRLPIELNLGTFGITIPNFIVIDRITIQYTSGIWSGIKWTIENVISINGNKFNLIGTPSGNFLSTIATDPTITGNGTVGNPLTVVQNYVTSTGTQTISGVKTFNNFPITPSTDPSYNYEVANKKYIDNHGVGTTTILSTSTAYVDIIDTSIYDSCNWLLKINASGKKRLSEIISQENLGNITSTEYGIVGDDFLVNIDVDYIIPYMRLKITNNEIFSIDIKFRRTTI